MFIHITAFCIFLFLLFRFILPLPVKAGTKAVFAALFLLISQQHLFSRYVFGGLSSPELPVPVLLFQGWSYTSLLFLLLLVLIRDVTRIGRRLLRLNNPLLPAFSPGRRQLMLGALATATAAYGVCKAVEIPAIRERETVLSTLPRGLDGLCIAHVTDLHVSPLLRADWVREVVTRINGLNPDLVVITGDIVDGLPARRNASMAPLAGLSARYGVFACPGNHEYYSNYGSWMERFPDLGLTMLPNTHAVVNIGDDQLVLAGVTDIVAERFGLPLPSIHAALAGAPSGVTRILLDHRPGNAPANASRGVHLQLSGHTHGGHMTGMDAMVARFNNGYVRGWYDVNGMRLYVNSGAGLWNGFPVRLGVPSEITRLVLRSGSAPA